MMVWLISLVSLFSLVSSDSVIQTYDKLAYDNCQYFFIVAGGSTSANTGSLIQRQLDSHVLAYVREYETFLLAVDPLDGGDGIGGSPWVQFAFLMRNQTNATICLADVSFDKSLIEDWYPYNYKSTYFNNLIDITTVVTKYSQNKPIYVLWQHGESNSNYLNYDYKYETTLSDIITRHQNTFPTHTIKWFVSQTSYSPWNNGLVENFVRQSQQNIVSNLTNVYAGPNTDSLCMDYRNQPFYFNKKGLDRVAYGWFQAFQHPSNTFSMGSELCGIQYYTFWEYLFHVIFVLSFIAFVTFIVIVLYYGLCYRKYQTNIYYYITGNEPVYTVGQVNSKVQRGDYQSLPN